MQPRSYATVASVILLAEGTFAAVHRLLGGEYGQFAHIHNIIIDVAIMVIWFAAGFSAMFPGPSGTIYLVMLGIAVSVIHGVLFCLSTGTAYGLPFLVAAAVLVWVLVRSAPAWRNPADTPSPFSSRPV
jgi:hypothetical protein